MPTLHRAGKDKVVKGFRINGFLNHYPDFIVKTKAGRDYRYMMVFGNNPVDGAGRLADALAKIRQL